MKMTTERDVMKRNTTFVVQMSDEEMLRRDFTETVFQDARMMIAEKISDMYIEENYAAIMEKLPIKAIMKLLLLRISSKIAHEVGEGEQ